MSTASMSVKTAELLKCSETEFDKTIQEMSLKDLLEAISSLQKEMTKEQENFNSLGTELGALNKNSQQYKQISKEMTQSQSKLTVLMNRSMKCFQQQGNQQSKQKSGNNQVQRRNSARNATQNSESGTNVQRRHSAKIKPEEADVVNIAIEKQTAKSTPTIDTAGQNKPVVLKPLTTVDTSKFNIRKNETNNPKNVTSVSVNSSSNSSSTTQNGETSHRSAFKVQPKTTRGKILALSRMEPEKSVTVIKTESTSRSESVNQNGVTEHEPTSNVSSVVNVSHHVNGAKDSSVTSKYENKTENSSDNVAVKVNGSAMQKPPRKLIKSSGEQPSGENLLEQIRNFKRTSNSDDSSPPQTETSVKDTNVFRAKPIEIKPAKTENTESKPIQRNSQEQKPPLVFHAGRPIVLDANVEQERRNMLHQIKAHKKSDTQHEQLAELEKEKKPFQLNTDNQEAKITNAETRPVNKELQTDKKVSASGVGKVSMAMISLQRNSREIKDFVQPKQTISVKQTEKSENVQVEATQVQNERKIEHETQDEIEENEGINEPELEPDTFRSEFSFPSKSKVNQSVQKTVAAPTQTQSQAVKVTSSGNKMQEQNKQEKEISQEEAAGVPIETGDNNEDDEIAPKRINLRDWDPHLLLKDLYRIEMVKNDVQDISDKFINMEGLMEKLPMNKKKATLLKTWKRRFFRAKDGWLHYYETSNRDKPSDSIQLMGGRVDDLGNRILGIDDGRGRYLMVRCPTENEYGQWKLALDTQTADNVKATYIRPCLKSPPNSNKKIIVIDLGSSGIRAGILGQEATLPEVFFPSVIARERNSGTLVVGEDAFKPNIRHKSIIQKPVRPTTKGDKDQLTPLSIDMDSIQEVFKIVFERLKLQDIKQYWIMLSTPQTLGDKIKEGLMKVLVDEYQTQGVCMVQQSLLALYSYNATSGVIVDVGERMEILPIYDGYVIEGGVSRQSYGGPKVAESLKSSLIENKYKFLTPVEQFIVRHVMEQSCYVSSNYKDSVSLCERDPGSCRASVYLNNYDLPEGAHLCVTHDLSCFKSPEGFFNSDMWGMDYPCVHKLVFQAIQSCPIDSRKHMYRSVYLSGGTTLLPGFAERLQSELTKLAPPAVVVEVHGSPQRYHAAFIGACAMAKMAPTDQTFISADEWKKMGHKAFKKWSMGGS